MQHLPSVALLLSTLVFAAEVPAQDGQFAGKISASDFPWWRGQTRDGHANADQKPPLRWSATENVLWRVPIPGRGHGSATVLGDQVFITAADLESDAQYVICIDRNTGVQKWRKAVHTGGLKTKGNRKQNKKASLASTTIATDGDRLYVNFLNNEAVWTSALSLDGKIVWQKEITKYVVHQGFGSSPAIYQDLLIVSADNKGGGAVVALNRSSGDEVWRHKRPKKPNYSSPVILNAAGKEQLIMIGCDLVTSLDPATGNKNWEFPGATTECVISTVTDGKNIFTSGGYPKNHISAVAADGSGKLVWENKSRAYVPSFLLHDGHLYAVLDAGIAVCFDVADGSEVWKKRLGGTFSSSPVMVGDNVYATNEEGETFIFKAKHDGYKSVAKNKLGENVFSTMTICGSRIYTRVAITEGGKRKEYLYCIGK